MMDLPNTMEEPDLENLYTDVTTDITEQPDIKEPYKGVTRQCGICGVLVKGNPQWNLEVHVLSHTGLNRVLDTPDGPTLNYHRAYDLKRQEQARREVHVEADLERVRLMCASQPMAIRYWGGHFLHGALKSAGFQLGMPRYFSRTGRLKSCYNWIKGDGRARRHKTASPGAGRSRRRCANLPPPPFVNTKWMQWKEEDVIPFTPIASNLFTPSKWPDWKQETNPTHIGPTLRQCDFCDDRFCNCINEKVRKEIPKVVSAGELGHRIEATTDYKAGDLLGEFLGEIVPPDQFEDGWAADLYSHTETDEYDNKRKRTYLCQIHALDVGNWTRKVNHSCEANGVFAEMRISGRWRMLLKATRDIKAGEVIAIDYGKTYWTNKGLQCRCGSTKCISKKGEKRRAT